LIRFITFLLGRPYETCKSCETLKQQLAFVNDEKRQLTETLLSIVRPKTVEAAPIEINPITTTAGLFSRRRAALEARDRQEAQILREAKHIGKSDDNLKNVDNIDKLEKELGIEGEGA
jgi:hypothetical protein